MKKADAVSRTDHLFPHLVVGSGFAERCVVTNSNVHQTSHMHSDQSGYREAVRINHHVHAAAKLSQNDLALITEDGGGAGTLLHH